MLIAGSSNRILAKNISDALGSTAYVEANVSRFGDGELKVNIPGKITPHAVIIQSTSKPANDHLMELLLIIDAVKRAGATKIDVIMPYFGYSRQDRHITANDPISAKLVATLLEAANVHKLITLDLHSPQIAGFFNIEVVNLSMLDLVEGADLLTPELNKIIISPDIGGLSRAKSFSNKYGYDIALVNKTRTAPGQSFSSGIIGDVRDKHCILIDDIIDTAGTICNAAEELMGAGALSVECLITHAVLSGNALERIASSKIAKIYVSDTILQPDLPEKFAIISTARLFAKHS